MSQPYLGEIRMFGGNYAPAGWAFCEGQLLPIAENDALFTLIGTTYGGDGQSTFALPDLRGRLPLHQGSGFQLGLPGGVEDVTLTVSQIPAHVHPWQGSGGGATSQDPANNVLAVTQAQTYFNIFDAPVNFSQQAVQPMGGSQPHTNLQPYLCVSFIIALQGIYPQQN